jgi:hypothetical protein
MTVAFTYRSDNPSVFCNDSQILPPGVMSGISNEQGKPLATVLQPYGVAPLN